MSGQWKLVPVEPTETMVINGFESEPDECFTDDEAWEQYQEMSGCQQAAFRAKLCWAAMLGSAPTAPTNGPIEVVAVINEEGTIFKETVVEHRPGIELLPVGTELVDIAHVIRLTAERDALQQRLNAADQRIDELTAKQGVESVCWGSAALGTACGKCARCASLRLAAAVKKHDEKIPGLIETICGNFAIMIDEANAHYGWTFKKDPNGMWVSGRKATEAEMKAARDHAKILALFS